jgi:hypothetical protein
VATSIRDPSTYGDDVIQRRLQVAREQLSVEERLEAEKEVNLERTVSILLKVYPILYHVTHTHTHTHTHMQQH